MPQTPQNATETQKIESILDPLFITDLKILVGFYSGNQKKADKTKLEIAQTVNDMWPEHAGMFSGDKKSFYAECSRVANDGLSVRIFGESGETLRRWCEVAATYENMPNAETFLDALSFDHLEKARKLARDGRIQAPDHALAVAVNEGLSADDMKERFYPSSTPHPYDVISGHLAYMADRSHWEFIKSAQIRQDIFDHVTAIDTMVRIYLESEEKAI